MADPILINGYAYDHSSCRIRLDGFVEYRVKELDYSAAIENSTYLYGTSKYPVGRTFGQYKPAEASVTLYRAAWDEWLGRLGSEMLTKSFTSEVERSELGSPFTKDVLLGCRIIKHEHSSSEGGDPLVVKVTLHVMAVLPNGTLPLTDMRI